MQTRIEGTAYVLGDNIDTDQIIPAQYLTYNPSIPAEFKMFGKYALSGVPDDAAGLPKGHVPFHGPNNAFGSLYRVILGGKDVYFSSNPLLAPVLHYSGRLTSVVAGLHA